MLPVAINAPHKFGRPAGPRAFNQHVGGFECDAADSSRKQSDSSRFNKTAGPFLLR